MLRIHGRRRAWQGEYRNNDKVLAPQTTSGRRHPTYRGSCDGRAQYVVFSGCKHAPIRHGQWKKVPTWVVVEQAADDGQRDSLQHGVAGERMTEIVHANVFDAGTLANFAPEPQPGRQRPPQIERRGDLSGRRRRGSQIVADGGRVEGSLSNPNCGGGGPCLPAGGQFTSHSFHHLRIRSPSGFRGGDCFRM